MSTIKFRKGFSKFMIPIEYPELPQSVPWHTPTCSFTNLHSQKDQMMDNRGTWVPVNQNGGLNGKSNWSAFKHKFSTYAAAFGWMSEDCLNCLSVGLTEKAADFYAILLEQKQELTYRQLLSKLERRFGCTELQSVTQGLFEQATQAPGESLED